MPVLLHAIAETVRAVVAATQYLMPFGQSILFGKG